MQRSTIEAGICPLSFSYREGRNTCLATDKVVRDIIRICLQKIKDYRVQVRTVHEYFDKPAMQPDKPTILNEYQ